MGALQGNLFLIICLMFALFIWYYNVIVGDNVTPQVLTSVHQAAGTGGPLNQDDSVAYWLDWQRIFALIMTAIGIFGWYVEVIGPGRSG